MARTVEELKQDEKLTVEILELFPRQGEWTEEDYFRLLPETNRIIELSEGRIIITPAPTTQHQKILGKLHFLIYGYLLENKLGETIMSPLDVKLWKDKIRQPDIVFMSNEHKDRITEKYWGVPDLAMEILSESTAKEDRKEKFYEYASAGILEYWIVDPLEQSIEVFVLEKGAYVLFGKWSVNETAKSKLLASFEVNVGDIMT
jgi:Uma2 family endonuclease